MCRVERAPSSYWVLCSGRRQHWKSRGTRTKDWIFTKDAYCRTVQFAAPAGQYVPIAGAKLLECVNDTCCALPVRLVVRQGHPKANPQSKYRRDECEPAAFQYQNHRDAY